MTSIADLFDVLFSYLIGASDGEFFGNFIGGAEEEEIDVGASAMGEGLGETVEVEEKDDTSLGASAGDGDFLNDSVGMSNLSTVKR